MVIFLYLFRIIVVTGITYVFILRNIHTYIHNIYILYIYIYIYGWKQDFGFKGGCLSLTRSYLHGRFKNVQHNGEPSARYNFIHGAAGFSIRPSSIRLIHRRHRAQFVIAYADDTLLQVSGRPPDADILHSKLTLCIDDIDAWMASNRLKLNQEKTCILCCTTTSRLKILAHLQSL